MARLIDTIDVSSRPNLRSAAEAIRADAGRLHEAGIERVIVFGPVVLGEDRGNSDVDILIVPRPWAVVGGLRLAGWRNPLTEILGREADAVADEFLRDAVRASVESESVEGFHA